MSPFLGEMRSLCKSFCSAFAEIVFIPGPWVGAAIFALSLLYPPIALSGLAAVAAALLFGRLIGMRRDELQNGYYVYNPLLVGMSVGFLFDVTLHSLLLIAFAAVFTFLLTVLLSTLFSRASVPILSLPFTLVSTLVYLATLSYTSLFSGALHTFPSLLPDVLLPDTLEAFFTALGTIFFLPDPLVGMVIALLMLWHSRILFVLALAGFFAGVAFHATLLGSFHAALFNPYSFNYILIATALGGVFLVPSLASIALALTGVALAVLLIDATTAFWTLYRIPVFALPFNMTVIVMLFVLRQVRFKAFAYRIKQSPERTLDYALGTQQRFKSGDISIFLPFSGSWQVYQGFDDKWTHKGNWRYAYDFVIADEQGESYRGNGDVLEDYHAFNKPVLSPIDGYVIEVVNHLKDNPIGEVDTVHNWGNHLIVQSPAGTYVELSHFARGSITVKRGDYVEAGQLLGRCGNSGYSPQPHIHVQVQSGPVLGSPTLPFHFVAYRSGKRIVHYGNPLRGETLSALIPESALESRLNFVLESRYGFGLYRDNARYGTLELDVSMDSATGGFYFGDKAGNRLYFAKEAGMFYCYDYAGDYRAELGRLYAAVPRIPLNAISDVRWSDRVPVWHLQTRSFQGALRVAALLQPDLMFVNGEWHFVSERMIEGTIATEPPTPVSVTLHEQNGFERIDIGSLSLRREE